MLRDKFFAPLGALRHDSFRTVTTQAMNPIQRIDRLIGGSLFIAGTTIGAGMVALPITTGVAGFWPACALIVAVFFYMLASIFLLLEANFYCQDSHINIIGMAKKLIGPQAEWLAWLSFLVLLYAASAAYIEGSAEILHSLITAYSAQAPTLPTTAIVFTLSLAVIAYCGIRWMDALNRLLMLGLLLSYFISVSALLPQIEPSYLNAHHPSALWASIPVVVLSFTAHIVLPSLRSYLNDDVQQLRRAILYGMSIPLLMYLIWQVSLLGLFPIRASAPL